jgi:allantoin racemase
VYWLVTAAEPLCPTQVSLLPPGISSAAIGRLKRSIVPLRCHRSRHERSRFWRDLATEESTMKLLLINPNTTQSITELVLAEARKVAAPQTELSAVTGRFGGRYVASRATYAIAGHAALDAYAEHGRSADVVALACFGDPALMALKEVATQPVVGMAEASCLTAAALGGRFAIVTGGERWGPMLREFVGQIGLSDRLATIETVAPTGAEIAGDPQRSLDLLARACVACAERHGASSVILGGAGLAGLAARIASRVPVPLIDSLVACIRMAEDVGRHSPGMQPNGPGPTPTTGLSPGLTQLFSES